MSFAAVTPYFDTCLKSLGLKEWPDEYSIDTIPGSLLTTAYHLQVGDISGSPASHTYFNFDFPVILTIHSKQVGNLSTSQETNNLLKRIDDILCKTLAVENRYSSNEQGIKSIYVSGISVGPIDEDNLNITRAQITYQVSVGADYTSA